MALWHERSPPPEVSQTRPPKNNLTALPPESGDNTSVMVRFWRGRSAITDAVFAVVAVAVIAVGIVATSEFRFADAAGQPLGVPAVTITPGPVPRTGPSAEPNIKPSPAPSAKPSAKPSATATPTSSPTASPSSSGTPGNDELGAVPGPPSGDDEPEVVTGPPPVEVELDDHDELRNDDSPDDNSDDSPGDSSSYHD